MPGAPVVTILSDGKEMDARYEVMSVDIDKTVNKITSAQVTILDSGNSSTGLLFLDISDAEFFKPGNEFEIRLGYLEQSRSVDKQVFKGILVKHRIRMSIKGAYLTLTFKAPAIGMTRVRRNVVYPEKMTDTQIVENIISSYDKVEPGSIDVGDYQHSSEMVQYYCVDWDFILSRAAANGCWVLCDDNRLSVITPEAKPAADFTLDFSIESYYSFDMEISILDQIPALTTSGWDLTEQQSLQAEQSQATALEQGDLTPAELAQALGIPEVRLQSLVDIDAAEVESWADARLRQSLLSLYRGTLALPGTAGLKPGDTIEFKGLNERFNGRTIVSAIRHQLSAEGWQTHVQFGLSAGWLQHVRTMADVDAAGLVPGIHGLQVGIVQKFSKDQAGKFRIPVLIPAFSSTADADGDTDNIVLARLGTIDAGAGRGAFFHPEPDDEVILGFVNNDPRQPVILGSMHSPKNKPPDEVIDDSTGYKYKGFIIDEDMSLRFDKSADPAEINMVASAGNGIALTGGDEGSLTVEVKKDIQLQAAETLEMAVNKTKLDTKESLDLATKKTRLDTKESLDLTTKKTKLNSSASLGIETQSTDMKSQTVSITGKLDVK